MEGKIGVIASGQVWGKEPEQPNGSMTWIELNRYMEQHHHPARQRSRWKRRRYVATFADARAIGEQAAYAKEALGLHHHRTIVVADGAHWIKKEATMHFPDAQCILDWPHLWRTVRTAANLVGMLTQHSQHEHARVVNQLETWLWKGEVERAQEVLKQWRSELAGPHSHRLTALRQAITYLDRQREWIGSYEYWKHQGYPVGSGIIERAVALVINRRMKRRGMRWLRRNATAVVALRVDLLNHDWSMPASTRVFP
ncbi:hypothetical protein EPA93_36235 [Ktedonosporobacter rubrisoli]|nr:hypothetical protein EPA93_36235 [Ktedonosporobacter rubrisoli]